ncbi:DUF5946 family protein [Kitasatospora sp. NPDC004669]|uniref:DUF5946 family protein n=1 Tax=Kitasatospora sp. NPDC004669 TaxID=3154555 RepID=UPI0033A29733
MALDHAREEPWGPLHGVSVSCFLLQHPSRLPADNGARAREFLRAHLDGGLAEVDRLVGRARGANSHRVKERAPEAVREARVEAPQGGYAVTIAEAAVDGTFPAEGFPERVRAWAATVGAWGRCGT